MLSGLRTERLCMIPWTEALVRAVVDAPASLQRIKGITVADGFPNNPVRHFVLPATLAAIEKDPSYGRWSGLVVHSQDRRVIGSMGCKSPPDDQGLVEIGYDIVPAYQHQGYATEIGRAFVDWLQNETSVRRIAAECLADNVASIRVLEKTGFNRIEERESMTYWELPTHK